MTVTLLLAEHWWECPRCDFTDVTRGAEPHSRFHSCRGLAGLSVPMVPAGTRCKLEVNGPEDWVGGQEVQRDGEGRPVMNVVITRDEGTDCAVYAPCATMSLREVLLWHGHQ